MADTTQTTATKLKSSTKDDNVVPTAPPTPATERKLAPHRVIALGSALILVGMLGFYFLDGMIAKEAEGTRIVNAFYCSVITLTTVGFGDICPEDPTTFGKIFVVFLAAGGLGMFCGPIMNLASSWRDNIPGGLPSLASTTIALGVLIFTAFEGMSNSEAIYTSVITGTTIGYGDKVPHTDIGKVAVAFYAILVCNVVGALLDPARAFLETYCQEQVTQKQQEEQKETDPSKKED